MTKHWYLDRCTMSVCIVYELTDIPRTNGIDRWRAAAKAWRILPNWNDEKIEVFELAQILVVKKYIFNTEEEARNKRDELISSLEGKLDEQNRSNS